MVKDSKLFTAAKSTNNDEYLFSCLYSIEDIKVSVSNQIGLKVKSLFSESTLKYGIVKELPSTSELLIAGCKKPLFLFTDGSG